MIDGARKKIILSVPLVMVVNLSLLNYFFGDKNGIISKETVSTHQTREITENKSIYKPRINNFKYDNGRNVKSYPPPPPHTFVCVEP